MNRPRLAVLASGGGRSLENLAAQSRSGDLDVDLVLVIADRASAGVLQRAERLGIENRLILYSGHESPEAYAKAVFEVVESFECQVVVLAGFLRLLLPPEDWIGRVINIHPSLLPKYGGKGYYGEHVHRAVIAAGEKESGCTVHFVDHQYDHGDQILQRRISLFDNETPDSLAARVFEEEKLALPEAIRRVLAGLG